MVEACEPTTLATRACWSALGRKRVVTLDCARAKAKVSAVATIVVECMVVN
jgi:hypothetical protein